MNNQTNIIKPKIINLKGQNEIHALPFHEMPSAEVAESIAKDQGVENYTYEVKEHYNLKNREAIFTYFVLIISY